jgi:hypothetical protein
MKTAWNTGRLYGKAGQRMAAEYDAARRTIVFVDVDRGIDGTIEQAGRIENERELREVVMQRYDFGQCECRVKDYEQLSALNNLALTAPGTA